MAGGSQLTTFQSILIAVLTALATTVLVGLPLWRWQQGRLQRWSSRPVLDFTLTTGKVLTVRNLGLVNVADVSIWLTVYHISGMGQIGNIEKIGRPIKSNMSIPAGSTYVWYMSLDAGLQSVAVRFSDVTSGPPTAENQAEYAIRIVFRNAITQQKFVRYILTSSFKGPSMLNFSPEDAFGGSWDGLQELLTTKQKVLQNQMALFSDAEADVYR